MINEMCEKCRCHSLTFEEEGFCGGTADGCSEFEESETRTQDEPDAPEPEEVQAEPVKIDLFDETKAQKFDRLAQKRLHVVCDELRKLGNLANHNIYEWTDNGREELLRAIRASVDKLERKLMR